MHLICSALHKLETEAYHRAGQTSVILRVKQCFPECKPLAAAAAGDTTKRNKIKSVQASTRCALYRQRGQRNTKLNDKCLRVVQFCWWLFCYATPHTTSWKGEKRGTETFNRVIYSLPFVSGTRNLFKRRRKKNKKVSDEQFSGNFPKDFSKLSQCIYENI